MRELLFEMVFVIFFKFVFNVRKILKYQQNNSVKYRQLFYFGNVFFILERNNVSNLFRDNY